MDITTIFLGVIFGMALSVVIFFVWENRKTVKATSKFENIILNAESKKEDIIANSQKKADDIIKNAKLEAQEIKKKAEQLEERILKSEERIAERELKLGERLEQISKKQEEMLSAEESLLFEKWEIQKKSKQLDTKLLEISNLSEEEAKNLLMQQITETYESDLKILIEKHKKNIDKSKMEAWREILLKSIQQYAWDVTSEVTTTIIEIPSDDIKWKLIGKEGRNITAFERNTWVSLIIDDTPDSVFISGFDLYRRYIAKKSLEKLIEDWRIQPARIEEIVENTQKEWDILLKEIWEKILEELNIHNVPDEIIPVIGKLRFRTSYGQNILKHSKEVAIIAEAIWRELWVSQTLLRLGWLMHDIGKALDQEIEGTHPEIWWKLARKYGMQEEIIDMIENHHWEQFSISIYAAIVQIADAISSVRPGARREAIEQYMKRIQEMEALVQSFSWVDKAYALSAWREVRVFISAETTSDMQAQTLAIDIAKNIQDNLQYPGEVKVSVIRELRVIEYAK